MRLVIIGYGKMGKTIEKLATAKGHQITEIVDIQDKGFWDKRLSQTGDVAIEFTHPDFGHSNIKKCIEGGLPVVSGTTGWLDNWEKIVELCNKKNGAFFYASNFSLGVNIFFEINRQLAAIMDAYPDYEVNIEEIHHTSKKDAPSGTGITIANSIIDNLYRKSNWVNRNQKKPEELSIISKRIDPAPGTHIVNYKSAIDAIELKHTAFSREGFANGAIMAAEWLQGKKGVFGMSDLLGFG